MKKTISVFETNKEDDINFILQKIRISFLPSLVIKGTAAIKIVKNFSFSQKEKEAIQQFIKELHQHCKDISGMEDNKADFFSITITKR